MPRSRSTLALLLVVGAFQGLDAQAPAPVPAPKPSAKAKATTANKAPLPAPVKVTSVEGITEYRLANGLKVLLFPDPSKATLTVNITYLVGSRHESYGETGMAHLLEHLVFKPSKKFSGKDGQPTPVQVLNKLGARFNGTTSDDRTNYFISFPGTDENLALILDLEADRMVNANIDAKDLWDPVEKKGEMTVVRNEMEGGENNPLGITIQRTLAAAYEWHNYGKSTIGARTDVENVDIARLRAFYENYYQPDNAVLLVSGRMDEAKTLAMVNARLGAIRKPTRAIRPTYTLDPVQDGERSVTVRRVGDAKALVAAYKIPAGPDADSAALDVLAQVMSEAPSGRLHKALVESKKATFVFAFGGDTKEPGALLFGAQLPKEGDLEDAKSILVKAVEESAAAPVTQEEVDRAKQQILKQVELTLNESDRLGVGLSNYISQGDWRLFFLNRDRAKMVTAEQVNAVAAKYLKRENRTLGQFIPTEKPDRAEIPVAPDVAALVKDYKGGERVAQGEAFEATPANIDARTRTFTTAAGLKVAFLSKKTRGEGVNATLVLRMGSETSLMSKGTIGEVAAGMLMRGTNTKTRQQLKDEFDRLKAQVNLFGNAESVRASITTLKSNLPAVLDLVAEVLREPAFDAEELGKFTSERVAQMESSRREPNFLASEALQRHLDPYPAGHPKHTLTLDESMSAVKAVKAEDLKAFHGAFFGASAGEFAVVGDFDDKSLETQIKARFGAWKSATPFTRITGRIKSGAAPLDAKIEAPDKAQAIFLANLPLAMKDTEADYAAMVLGNYLLGGGSINSRIANRLRQKDGLSYGAGSQFNAGSMDAVASWSVFAIYAPENLARLEAAFQEELKLALEKGFDAKEIADAKTSWLQSQSAGRSQDRGIASALAGDLHLGRTFAWRADLEKKVSALGAEEILAALRKRIDPSKLSIARAGDFAKKPAAK